MAESKKKKKHIMDILGSLFLSLGIPGVLSIWLRLVFKKRLRFVEPTKFLVLFSC